MTPTNAEKRRDKRLHLTLPVKFHAKAEDILALCDGVTRNVSSGGVYLEIPAGIIGPNDSVRVRIAVPARHDESKANLTLIGSGVVCRVEPLSADRILGSWSDAHIKQGICGVALQFQQRPTIELHSLEELLWEDHPR